MATKVAIAIMENEALDRIQKALQMLSAAHGVDSIPLTRGKRGDNQMAILLDGIATQLESIAEKAVKESEPAKKAGKHGT